MLNQVMWINNWQRRFRAMKHAYIYPTKRDTKHAFTTTLCLSVFTFFSELYVSTSSLVSMSSSALSTENVAKATPYTKVVTQT